MRRALVGGSPPFCGDVSDDIAVAPEKVALSGVDYRVHKSQSNFTSYPTVHPLLEVRGVEAHKHEQSRNETSARKSKHPTTKDPGHSLPVQRTGVKVHKSNTHSSTGQTLRRRDRQRQTRSKQYGDGSTKLNRETTSRRHLGQLVAQLTDNVVAKEPETDTEQKTGNDKHPHGSGRVRAHRHRLPRIVRSSPGANCVRDIVGTVRDRHDNGTEHLGVGPQVLDLGIVSTRLGVDLRELILAKVNTVNRDTVEQAEEQVARQAAGVVPGQVPVRRKETLLGRDLSLAQGLGRNDSGIVLKITVNVLHILAMDRLRLAHSVGHGTVVVRNGTRSLGVGPEQRRVITQEKRAKNNVVGTNTLVALDQTAMEVGHKEHI